MRNVVKKDFKSAEFGSHQDLAEFVREKSLNPSDMTTITFNPDTRVYTLFYWE